MRSFSWIFDRTGFLIAVEKPSISQSLAPTRNYTMGLPISSPGQTSDTGCRQPVSWVRPDLGRVSSPGCLSVLFPVWPSDPHCHLVSVLSQSQWAVAPDRTPQTDPGLGPPPRSGLSVDRARSLDLALPAAFRRCEAAPHGGGHGLSSWLLASAAVGWHQALGRLHLKCRCLNLASQCNPNHQPHDRCAWRFSLIRFPSSECCRCCDGKVARCCQGMWSVWQEQDGSKVPWVNFLKEKNLRKNEAQSTDCTLRSRYRRNSRSRKTFDITSRVKLCVEGEEVQSTTPKVQSRMLI